MGLLLKRITAVETRCVLDILFKDVISEAESDVMGTTFLGCNWTNNIVMALATELSLKALLAKKCKKPDHTHDLLKLYKNLPSGTWEQLENEFTIQKKKSGIYR